MDRAMLRDDQWDRIKDVLPGKKGDCGVTAKDNRLFVEAVLWLGRAGAPWRDLPVEFGPWHNVYVRFARWRDKNVWDRISASVSRDPDLEQLMIDSTIVRAHEHAAGAQKKRANKQSVVLEAV